MSEEWYKGGGRDFGGCVGHWRGNIQPGDEANIQRLAEKWQLHLQDRWGYVVNLSSFSCAYVTTVLRLP